MPFFSYCTGAHLDVHSFPTRRSSDLLRRYPGLKEEYYLADFEPDRSALDAWRSEEHTSELQSLTNLVCRLLLEKKNLAPAPSPGPAMRPDGGTRASAVIAQVLRAAPR